MGDGRNWVVMTPLKGTPPSDAGEFGRITGLSSKALRLYGERGLLVPSSKDATSGYRQYTASDVERAGRIALMRQAGISLSEIGRFLADPRFSTIEGWLAAVDMERDALERAQRAGPRPRVCSHQVLRGTLWQSSSVA